MRSKLSFDEPHPWQSVLEGTFDAAIEALFALGFSESVMLFGPAHIVWEDGNYEVEDFEWCLKNFDKYKTDHTEVEYAILKWSLEQVLEIMR